MYATDRPGSPMQTIIDMKDEDATCEAEMRRILGRNEQVIYLEAMDWA